MNLDMDSLKDRYDLFKFLENNPNWRIKKSSVCKQMINDTLKDLAITDYDILTAEKTHAILVDKKAQESNTQRISDMKNKKKELEGNVSTLEALVKIYEEEENAKSN